MSAIDNAFIRAYTNERTAAQDSARAAIRAADPSASAHVTQPLSAAAPRLVTAKIAVPKVSLAAAKAARSAARSADAADKVQPSAIVPAPHFDLSAFTHSSSTLDHFPDPIGAALKMPDSRHPQRPAVVPVRVDAGPRPAARDSENEDDDERHVAAVLLDSSHEVEPDAESIVDEVLPPARDTQLSSRSLSSPSVAVLELPKPLLMSPAVAVQELPNQAAAMPLPLTLSTAPTIPSAAISSATLPVEAPHRAGYDVEHFEWPAVSDALLAKLVGGLDHLAGELVTESALGRKVIAMTGLARGEGRTTLLLTLARRLAAGGVKVLVVDADFEAPQIGVQLGLLIDQGWNATLSDGAPLWDAMVESLSDRLTVMPLAPRVSAANGPTVARIATSTAMPRWDSLRTHFDVILIDAGPLTGVGLSAHVQELPASVAASDAVILAFDCRSGSESFLANAQRKLLDSNVFPLGVAETFCAEGN